MMSKPQYQHLVAQLDSEMGESENKAKDSSISLPSKPTRPKVILTSGLELDPRPVRWLWKDWLALGKMHILAGAPGQGKTTIALACAAIVSKGGCWPDGSISESGNILIWSGEDDPADTLLPRLLMAGADRARCYFVSGTRINGEEHSFDPARDMADLEAEVTLPPKNVLLS